MLDIRYHEIVSLFSVPLEDVSLGQRRNVVILDFYASYFLY
jgi:hypothetical protein